MLSAGIVPDFLGQLAGFVEENPALTTAIVAVFGTLAAIVSTLLGVRITQSGTVKIARDQRRDAHRDAARDRFVAFIRACNEWHVNQSVAVPLWASMDFDQMERFQNSDEGKSLRASASAVKTGFAELRVRIADQNVLTSLDTAFALFSSNGDKGAGLVLPDPSRGKQAPRLDKVLAAIQHLDKFGAAIKAVEDLVAPMLREPITLKEE